MCPGNNSSQIQQEQQQAQDIKEEEEEEEEVESSDCDGNESSDYSQDDDDDEYETEQEEDEEEGDAEDEDEEEEEEEEEESVEEEEERESEVEDDSDESEEAVPIEAEAAIENENIIKNVIKNNINLGQYNNTSFYDNLHEIVDEMITDFTTFCRDIPSLSVIWGKLIVFIWCMIMVIIPIIVIHHSCDANHRNSKHHDDIAGNNKPHEDNSQIPKSITDPLRSDYVRIMNDNGDYLTLTQDEDLTFTNDANDQMAIWNVEIHQDTIKLKNKETDKYLRIDGRQKVIKKNKISAPTVNCGGTGIILYIFLCLIKKKMKILKKS